jgi:hypothetical protein
MNRTLSAAFCALLLVASASPAHAFMFVSGSNARSGDLVAVWAKNGFELIVNLGAIDALPAGEVASFAVPTQFGGDLVGAKFTALGVPNPDAVFGDLGFDPPLIQNNIALTTLDDPFQITFVQVADAESVLDPGFSQTWLPLLKAIPAAGSPGVISNSNSQALIESTLFASYTGNLGFASDAIANTLFQMSTAVTSSGDGFSIPLYQVFQTITLQNGEYLLGTEVTRQGLLVGDVGLGGTAHLSFHAVPEPGAVALLGLGFGGLGLSRRRVG